MASCTTSRNNPTRNLLFGRSCCVGLRWWLPHGPQRLLFSGPRHTRTAHVAAELCNGSTFTSLLLVSAVPFSDSFCRSMGCVVLDLPPFHTVLNIASQSGCYAPPTSFVGSSHFHCILFLFPIFHDVCSHPFTPPDLRRESCTWPVTVPLFSAKERTSCILLWLASCYWPPRHARNPLPFDMSRHQGPTTLLGGRLLTRLWICCNLLPFFCGLTLLICHCRSLVILSFVFFPRSWLAFWSYLLLLLRDRNYVSVLCMERASFLKSLTTCSHPFQTMEAKKPVFCERLRKSDIAANQLYERRKR